MVNDVAALRRCGVEIDETKAMARRWTEARYGTTAGRKRAGGQVGGTRKRKAGGGSESSWGSRTSVRVDRSSTVRFEAP